MTTPDEETRVLPPPVQSARLAPGTRMKPGVLTVRAGGASSISRETRELLRLQLLRGSAVIGVGLAIFAVRDLLIPGPVLPWVRAAAIVAFLAFAYVLRGERKLTLRQLRMLEVAMMVLFAAWFALDRFVTLHRAIVSARAVDIVYTIDFMSLVFVGLIAAYAVFVPNTWMRALRMTLPMSLVPTTVTGMVWLVYPQDRAPLADAVTVVGASSRTLMLLLMVAVAAAGARLIHSLRRAALEARELGHYRLVERVGSGGMGEVWRAEHSMLRRTAAVKLIRPDRIHTSNPEEARTLLRSFQREAAATAALRSPHTVQLYDFGVTEDRIFYYVMEMLDGMDMAELVLAFGPQPDARVISLLLQVCESLQEAHELGLVHGDVKPGNIFVCRLGPRRDFVKVLDFGLVAPLDPDLQSTLSASGRISGTPAYMAPEAIRAGVADPSVDLYSLGCVAYWLLTGTTVFEAATPAGHLVAHLHDQPLSPSERLGRVVDPTLEAVVMACLRKDPTARPRSAAEVAGRLATSRVAGLASRQEGGSLGATASEHAS